MNAKQMAQWSDKNAWGADQEGGERRSYYLPELERLADIALQTVPRGGLMVEIGVYGGRSLAILLQVARELGATVWACDPFVWNGHISEPKLRELLTHFTDVDCQFYPVKSEDMREMMMERDIHLLHIDGDHYHADVDCRLWLPCLVSGGVVVFHDVVNDPRSPIYEGVYCAIQPYIKDWELLWWAEDEEGHQMARRKP